MNSIGYIEGRGQMATGPGPVPRAAALLAALAVALLPVACSRQEAAAPRAPRAVESMVVERRAFALEAEYAARILPASQVNVTPKVGGRVERVLARVGDFVRKDQPLLTLESGDYDAQYRQAQAALQSSRANLTRSNETGQESQVIQAQANLDQAQVASDETQKAWDKMKRLYDGGAASRQQMDDLDARLKAAGIQLEAARKALELVRDKSGRQAGDVLSGQVDAAQAQADLAKSLLDATALRSPLDGHVSYCDAEPGAMIGTQSLVFVVIDDSSVLAEAGLSDRSIGFVHKGMSLKVSIPALRGAAAERTGVVDRVAPASDPRTLLYAVRVSISNADGAIRPGMLAKIRFPIEQRRQALLVPERSTFTENGIDYLFVVGTGGVARRVQVTLGESDGSSVEVLSGLEAGTTVITAGQEFLADGDAVNAAGRTK